MSEPALRLVEKKDIDKEKALDAALSQIERNFGKGSIMKLGAQDALDIEAISTGSLGLDIARLRHPQTRRLHVHPNASCGFSYAP